MSSPDTWQARQKVELTRCLASFEDQFREWESRTERSPWEIHYSQVRAVVAHMGAVRDRLQELLAGGQDDQIELRVLSAWRVWEAFRNRLSQRQEELFRTGLAAADEIAWACRLPVAKAVADAGGTNPKEPALSFLNGSISPCALARDRPFSAEPVFGESLTKASERLLEHLPVPLIGLPWHEIAHAPGMVAISHETGHIVEADFQLTPALDAAFDTAVPASANLWKPWRAEIFADQYGLRHCGLSYAAMMIDLLAPRWGTPPAPSYPPHPVRMELCFATLEAAGLKEADDLRTRWKDRISTLPPIDCTALLKDVPNVVDALGKVPIGGRPFAQVMPIDANQAEKVNGYAGLILRGDPLDADATAPLIVAAAWRAFELNPSFFETRDASEEVCARILQAPGSGSRRRRARRTASPPGSSRRLPEIDVFAIHADAGKRFAEVWLQEKF